MQHREMRKNIETIKQGLRNGTDTGSIKFLDDMEKLSGLVLQLKVKIGFVVSDDLDEVVDEMLHNLITKNQGAIDIIIRGIPTEQRLGYIMEKLLNSIKFKKLMISSYLLRHYASMRVLILSRRRVKQ